MLFYLYIAMIALALWASLKMRHWERAAWRKKQLRQATQSTLAQEGASLRLQLPLALQEDLTRRIRRQRWTRWKDSLRSLGRWWQDSWHFFAGALLLIGILYVALPGWLIPRVHPVPTVHARQYRLQLARVQGDLVQISTNKSGTYLNFDRPYPNNTFYALIDRDTPDEIRDYVNDLALELRKMGPAGRIKDLEILGRISTTNRGGRTGKPHIVLHELSQLRRGGVPVFDHDSPGSRGWE